MLRAIALFDRDVWPEVLERVLPERYDEETLGAAMYSLTTRGLLRVQPNDGTIGCHPQVRAFFAENARRRRAEYRSRNLVLYEYFRQMVPERPDSVADVERLFQAVHHACQAGAYGEAFQTYHRTLMQGNEFRLTDHLGLFEMNLALLTRFFDKRWAEPVVELVAERAWLVSHASFALRGVGLFKQAVTQLKQLGLHATPRKLWKDGQVRYGTRSQLYLILGRVADALDAAREAERHPEKETDNEQRTVNRLIALTDLADVLHQAGKYPEALNAFEEAERLQSRYESRLPQLYSVPGYRYCDLLITSGRKGEARERAEQMVAVATRPLDRGLRHLILGRSHPKRLTRETHLDQAVAWLTRANAIHHLPRGYVARGSSDDLRRAFALADRFSMRIFRIEAHLATACIKLREGRVDEARAELDEAHSRCDQTGYVRGKDIIQKIENEI